MDALSVRIRKRIHRKGRGAVFAPKDFLDLGGRAIVDQTLSRLCRRGTIRRLGRGLYDYPRISSRLGPLSHDLDDVARAVARQTDSRLQVSGARAANALGLTTQVPAKSVYLTDGPSRRIEVGNQVVRLRHTSRKNLAGAGKASGLVFQALRYLGRDSVDQGIVERLRRILSPRDKLGLQRDSIYAPDWIRSTIDRIVRTV